jgi:hypothetical protein
MNYKFDGTSKVSITGLDPPAPVKTNIKFSNVSGDALKGIR